MYTDTFAYSLIDETDNEPALVFGDWLFVGSLYASRNLEALQRHGITHIFSAVDRDPYSFDSIEYMRASIMDTPSQSLEEAIRTILAYLYIREKNKQKTLVHCVAGISRSVSLIIAYLIVEHNMTYSDALLRVRQTRREALPNVGFEKQLCELEKEIAAEHTQSASVE